MYFANIDYEGYCVGISSYTGTNFKNNPYCIPIDCYDTSFMGRKYDFQENVWKDEWKNKKYDIINPLEIIGQKQTDIELALFEAQEERAMMAQQITDIELSILEGGIY